MLKAYSTDKEHLIKSGIQYLKNKFSAAGNNFSTSKKNVRQFFLRPSATDAVQELGTAK
jgi:hypothetical protein